MTKERFSVKDRLRSFGYAFEGIGVLLKTQHNARIHLVATGVVIGLGLWFGVSTTQWCLLIFAMLGVWVTEAMNTALEFLADVASPEQHPLIKKAKDVAAAAVLIAVVGAVVVGGLVFLPYMVCIH